jgi:hypothetical protein
MDYTAIRQLQIRFSAQTEYGRYTDALYYPEGNVPDEKALAAEVQKRVDAWVATVSAPPEPPTDEQRKAMLDEMGRERERLVQAAESLRAELVDGGVLKAADVNDEKAKLEAEIADAQRRLADLTAKTVTVEVKV